MSAGPTAADQLQTVFELSDIVMDPEVTFVERLERALETGSERLDFTAGFLTNIDRAAGKQEILVLTGGAGGLQEGVTVPLAESYCRKTVAAESGTMTVADAQAEGWAGDPAYQRFELGSYVGSVLAFDGERQGTLCFADDDPFSGSFDDVVGFVELLARWASYELAVRTGRDQAAGNGVLASFVDPLDRDAVDVALGALSNQLRRDLLVALVRSDGPVTVADVAADLAASDDRPARSPERVEVALVHRHIPKLRDADVVTYDEEHRELSCQPTEALDRLLGQISLLER